MRILRLALLAALAACDSATEPVSTSPTVVPAGAGDFRWAAIGKVCSPESPVYTVPRVRLDSAPTTTHGPGRTIDDDWADAARAVPGGWAGVILENNTPVIFLVDTTKKAEALAALAARGTFSGGGSGTRVRAARWDFAQLAEWFRYLQLHMPFGSAIVSADIDEAANRLTYGLRNAASRATVEQVLAKLDLPCFLVGLE